MNVQLIVFGAWSPLFSEFFPAIPTYPTGLKNDDVVLEKRLLLHNILYRAYNNILRYGYE